jgi:hypothetical protein
MKEGRIERGEKKRHVAKEEDSIDDIRSISEYMANQSSQSDAAKPRRWP